LDQSINKFKQGNQYVNVASAVTKNELTSVNNINDTYQSQSVVKFVPASGAATRMFKQLYTFIDDHENTEFIDTFFNHIEQFAFYDELLECIDMDSLNKDKLDDRIYIVRNLLNNEMNYGSLPKALIEFHEYDHGITTPIDEHVYEGEQYLDSDQVNLHFTISKEDEDMFNDYTENILKEKDNINIAYSFQKSETNTLAVDMDNQPLVLGNGDVLYRPGGHGALLENLTDLEEDIIFIKNIDNVNHQSRTEATIESKKKLAAIGTEVKRQIDQYLLDIESDTYDLDEIVTFIEETLNIHLKNQNEWTKDKALEFLNRPLRVAGVVKNEGEPGGGPYVVDNGDYYDLQICETSEIDGDNEKQVEIMNASEYFNPVDLVCFVRDYKGEKFDLMEYANEERYFISEKTYEGEPLKALEHPGLWNGAMHHWNTVFVEVPLSTFNPVKTVNDLLKEGHQPDN